MWVQDTEMLYAEYMRLRRDGELSEDDEFEVGRPQVQGFGCSVPML